MKLYIIDHLGSHKTTRQIEKWFTDKGHEVRWDMYYDPPIMEWCDVAFFAWAEGMMQLALRDEYLEKKQDWSSKNIVVQGMDIEVWSGQPAGTEWKKIDNVVYCSKFIGDLLLERFPIKTDNPELPIHHIPLSVDMNEWAFKERSPGRNIGVIGHMWNAKGAQLIPQFMRKLIDKSGHDDWRMDIQGYWKHDTWEWYFYYFNHMIKELGLTNNVFLNETPVDSIDQWLEDKNYLVTFSMKDAFSIIVGEAMAKGIKAFPHNFPGSKDIWGKYVWTSVDEVVDRVLNEDYNSQEYRDYVASNYSNEIIMPKWEAVFDSKTR